MPTDRVAILMVDDRPENLQALEALLADPDRDLVPARSGNDALRLALKTDFALVLLDVQMPGMDGFETAQWLRANPKTRHLPIIFITAGMDEAIHPFKGYEAGAVDYLVKPIRPEVLISKVQVFCDLARQRRALERRDQELEDLVRSRTADLTAAVAELRRSQERYQRLLASITSYVYSVEVEAGRPGPALHGPGCQAVTGYPPEAFRDQPHLWLDLVDPEDRPAAIAQVQTLLVERCAASLEHRIRHRDGGLRWVRSTLVPHLDPHGRLVGYDGVILDITDRKRAEDERMRLEECLAQAQRLESLGNLAGGVAHDLNNVLAAILGLASISREQMGDAEHLGRSLDTITTACLRGREVVKSLLSFARKDLNERVPVDLNVVVWEVVQLLEATTLKRVRILTDLEQPLPAILGDPTALGQVLMNLGLNGVDAMPQGGTLELRSRWAGPGRIELRVRDTGTGMSPDVLKRALDPFFTTKPVGQGTGLGLATAYGIMQAHGGTLELASEPGQGTEVMLVFPVAPAAVPAPEAPAAEPEAGTSGPAPLRILLVDDDPLIRAAIPDLLQALGHPVQTADGGQEALDQLAAGLEVDLVILDMRMPGLDGAETLARLRVQHPDLPVLLASGHTDESLQAQLAADPQLGFLSKPFTIKEIQERLARWATIRG
jgi:PAS domain S-box-containing protein